NRPIRERSVEDIIAAIQSSLKSTGYEDISLLSLSSSDHKQIVEIVNQVQEHFGEQKLTVTLPSLRIASFSVELMDQLKGLRQGGGFTIAPEAATERLRAIINKPLSDTELMETVKAVFEHGWMSLKLYFMIGLPEETMDDVKAIIEVCRKIKSEGRAIIGGRVRINVGIGTFLPKPHTPFQWLPADSSGSIEQKLSVLREEFRQSGIKMSYNRSASTSLETWLSRGDRRIGKVIHNAWKNGARFDAWSDKLNFQAWLDAFQEADLDPAFYAERMRDLQEILPWDHISVGLRKDFLIQDLQWSLQGKTRPDCRDHCYRCGILPQFEELRINTPDAEWSCP
ncbi:MAG: radical SAM protein, partial [Anaerolineaceae bacterium]|nr:radical SAM protein [Anaerolineaceae bacterium]